MGKIFCSVLFIITLQSCVIGVDSIREEEYHGVIIDIYRVLSNHNELTFLVKTEKEEFEMLASFWRPSSKYAAVGDSIIKIKSELKLTIKKPNGDSRTFEFWNP